MYKLKKIRKTIFAAEECDYDIKLTKNEKMLDMKNLLFDKVNERLSNCSNYLDLLFKVIYRDSNQPFKE